MRRYLLWLLPLACGVIVFWMWEVDFPMEKWGVGKIIVPLVECRANLRKVERGVAELVGVANEKTLLAAMPSQTECRRLLAEKVLGLAGIGCPLPYNHPRSDPLSSYLINPRVFTRRFNDWKATDVVAVDSEPRHFADLRGPGIRSVIFVPWEGELRQAYYDECQAPPLTSLLQDFANGADGSDSAAAWDVYTNRPRLDLTWPNRMLNVRLGTVVLLGVIWIVLLVTSVRQWKTPGVGEVAANSAAGWHCREN